MSLVASEIRMGSYTLHFCSGISAPTSIEVYVDRLAICGLFTFWIYARSLQLFLSFMRI